MFIGVPVFQKLIYNFIPLFPPLPEKFMIAPLFSYNSTTFLFNNTKPLLALSLVTTEIANSLMKILIILE